MSSLSEKSSSVGIQWSGVYTTLYLHTTAEVVVNESPHVLGLGWWPCVQQYITIGNGFLLLGRLRPPGGKIQPCGRTNYRSTQLNTA